MKNHWRLFAIILAAALILTWIMWPKPQPDDQSKAAIAARDSIDRLYRIQKDCTQVAYKEKAIALDSLEAKIKAYNQLISKYDKMRNNARALSADGRIRSLHSWLRDSIPD